MPNYKQIFAIKNKNRNTIKKLCPQATDESGIYVFHRIDENGFKHAYVGLATKSLLTRLAQHLEGYDTYIDISLKKHKLYDPITNPFGYRIDIICYCRPDECNDLEQKYIKEWADKGYQLKNTTGGSQGKGKFNINENKPSKGYMQGLRKGYSNAQRDVRKLFEKNLTYSINGKPTVLKERAYQKFKDFLSTESEETPESDTDSE